MTIHVKKSFNIKSIYGKNRFGFGVYGKNTRIYGHSSEIPISIPYLDIITQSSTIDKDTPSVNISFTTVNIENVQVWYKINDGSWILEDTIQYDVSPYTFVITGKGIVDDDILSIKLQDASSVEYDTVEFTMSDALLEITSIGGDIYFEEDVTINYNWNDITYIDVYYKINGDDEVFFETITPLTKPDSYVFNTGDIPDIIAHYDTLRMIFRNETADVEDYIEYNVICKELTITSLNEDVPLTLAGSYEDGVDYFFSTDGGVVPSSSPFRSGVYVGTGNADNNIDVDVKALAIDVDAFTVPVLLDIDFTVSGTATLVSDKVYIEAYNGSVWVDLNNGNPVNVVLGEFELTTAQLKASDGFESNMTYVVRARDFDGYATSSQENIETYDMIYGTTEEGGAVVEDEMGNIFTFSD